MQNNDTPKSGPDAQSGQQEGIEKKTKKPVDVATLEESSATSITDSDNDEPVAVGEASS